MTDPAHPAALEARSVSKQYIGGDGTPLRVLDTLELRVERGESIAIIGHSGTGKSTLLNLLGGLDHPDAGGVWVDGFALNEMDDETLSGFRSRHIGFVFQFHHLLREFTAEENVMMPQRIAGRSVSAARSRARELLTEVGLGARLEHLPGQLSGGEQQRVAVARALANEPKVLLADEPSGNLDPSTSGALHDLLFRIAERHESAMVLVTHNLELAARADRILELESGRLVAVDEQVGPVDV